MSRKAILKQANSRLRTILDKLYPAFRNFPRNEVTGLVHYLKTYLFETISYFNIAIKVVSQRIVKMQQIQANLETIKTLLKLSKKERAISISFHEDLDNRLGKVSNLLVKAFKAH